MRAFRALFRRQLKSYFSSPGSYIVMAAFLAVAGLSFRGMAWRSLVERLEAGEVMFGSALFWFAVLTAITLTTMRLLAEEKGSGTLETLLTAPVTDVQVVIAKYAAAVCFFIVMCAPLFLNVIVIMLFNAESGAFDLLPILLSFLMFLLVGAACIAYGLFASSLTGSQVVAGIICFAGLSVFLFSESLQSVIAGERAAGPLAAISGIRAVLDVSRGMIDTRSIVVCFCLLGFFLFATVKSLESRQWR